MKTPYFSRRAASAASFKVLASAFCVFLAAGSHLNATLLVYDGFNTNTSTPPYYTAGLLGNGATGQSYAGTGFASGGKWTTSGTPVFDVGTSSSALTYAGVASNDTGGVYSTNVGGRDVANLAAPLTGNNTYYISLMMKNTLVSGDYRAFELASGSSDASRIIAVGANADTSTSGAYWGMRVNNGSAQHITTVAATANATVFAVIKLTYSTTAGNSSATLWIDPTNLSSETLSGTTNSVTFTGLTFADATNIRFAQFNTFSTSYWDEVRIGTSWADVTPVPEPATWGLLAFGLASTVIFRRRKH